MSQLSQRDSIREADIIQQVQPLLLHQSSDDISETKNQCGEKEIPRREINQQATIAPWRALLQYENRAKEEQTITEFKPKSDKQQLLKKIRKQKSKSKSKSISENTKQPILSLPHRKIKPEKGAQLQSDQQANNTTGPRSIQQRTQALNNARKNKYRKKNYNFEDKVTKIKDIRAGQNNINIKGQIIFVWEKQLISQKWAKTEMICIEVWDGSGSIVVAIPFKLAVTRMWELEIGKYVSIQRAQTKQKYPRRLCMLLNQKSQIQYLNKNQAPKQALIQPQKLGLTIKQLENEPVGRICNVVCLIIHKEQKQFIRNARNADLCLSKLIIYDPIDKKTVTIKLWQEKADLKFFVNATVYLLRGVQVKEFKGLRQYDASKDFNWRILGYSRIGEYLREFYDERDRIIELLPSNFNRMNIKQSISIIERLKLQAEEKEKKLIKIEEKSKQQQQASPSQNKKQNIQPPTEPQTVAKIQRQAQDQAQVQVQNAPQLIFCSWSITILKLTSIQLNSQVTIKYTKCSKCRSRTMANIYEQSRCQKCSTTNSSTDHYSVKCQFYDGNENYLGDILDQAGEKLFSIQDQVMKIGFLEQTNSVFKQRIVKQVIGDTVKAVVVSTRERLSEDVWVKGYYIVDILPFDDENTQQTYNQSLVSLDQP